MPALVSKIVDVYVFRRRGAAQAGVEFLQLRRAGGGRIGDTWQAVHGTIEAGEAAWQTALRELGEETSLTPLRFWQLEHVNTFYVAAEDAVYLCPCFAAEVAPDAQVRPDDDHTAFRWLAHPDAVPHFMWPGQRQAIREIGAHILAGSDAEPHLRIALPAKAAGAADK
ncbi:MAG: NUDIX domain-containing protein [Planctomycetes bacterium]|nr:NUDIX domain-containing protein [Planctomycetota bacterium]